MKYIAVILTKNIPKEKIIALNTESEEVKKRVKSIYKDNKIIIISNSYAHFRAAVITNLKLLQMMEKIDEVLKYE